MSEGKTRHRGATRQTMRVLIEPRTVWLAAAVVVSLAVGWIVVARGLAVLLLLFLAIVFAEGIRPLVRWLSRSFLPRSAAILLIYLTLLIVVAGLVFLLARPIVAQAGTLVQHYPQYISHLQQLINGAEQRLGHNSQFSQALTKARSQLIGALKGLIPALFHAPITLLTLIFQGLTILFMAFFWLTEVEGLKGFVVGLLPPEAQNTGSAVLAEMGKQLGGYVRGTAVNMVIAGILVWAGLALLGVPYALLLGLLAGLTNLVPVIGTYVAAGAGIVVALLAVGLLKAGEVWLFYIVIQQLQGSVLQPLVLNRVVNINPLTVIFATLLGGSVLGVIGAVIGVPVALVIRVLLTQVLAPALRRGTGAAH